LIKDDNLTKSKISFSRLKKSLKFRYENKFFLEQWFLIYDFQDSLNTESLNKFQKIIPPKDRFWADPHIVFKNNTYYIFFEEFDYQQNKGHISYFTIDQDGKYSKPTKIIEQPFHLSYPFVFEYENQMFMIPETKTKKSIQLYKCLKFPEKWEFQKNLLTNIDAVDSTIFFYENKWWMFTGIRENIRSDWNNLHIFFTDNPTTANWIPHPMNLITKNIKNSRPAGAIFIEDGQIFRPAQISSIEEYGKAIVINQINILNENNYEEEEIKIIEPWEKRIKGIHTLNHANKLTILDAKWKIKR
jgi:hypothetical protein